MDLLQIATSITKFDDYYKFATVHRQLGARASGAGGGARFSKVPVTFRARNQIFISKCKELQTTPFCFIT